jgi:hypothetical protein
VAATKFSTAEQRNPRPTTPANSSSAAVTRGLRTAKLAMSIRKRKATAAQGDSYGDH